MSDKRGPWYLLTGLALGLILGLVYAWAMQPVEYVDTSPALLRADFKDRYRALIASAYLVNGDLVRAKARLGLLEDKDMYRALAEQAQRTLAEGNSPEEARALGLLAIALGQAAPGPAIVITQAPLTPTASATPTATSTPTPAPTEAPTLPATSTPTLTDTPIPSTPDTLTPTFSITPRPTQTLKVTPSKTPTLTPTDTPTRTHTPTVTPGGPFTLVSRQKICDQKLSQPLIQVEAVNALGQPIQGVLVIVTWDSGEERFYTGLKPEKGLGYADFTATPGVIYTLRLGEGGDVVPNLAAAECQLASGEHFWGAWLLKFKQS
jgi:hypothetical protein